MSNPVNCQQADTSNCTAIVGCAAGYGSSSGCSNTDCVKCEGTTFKQDAGNAACNSCTGDGAIGIPARAISEGNTLCGCSAGYAGQNATASGSDATVTCTKCVNQQYTDAAGTAACKQCATDQLGVPTDNNKANSANGPNIKCFCSDDNQGLLEAGCVTCKGDGQTSNQSHLFVFNL